jgi:alpha-1,6-mannosyltransferase
MAVARFGGLVATTLMAVMSWWVGALPWQDRTQLAPIVPDAGPGWRLAGLVIWFVAAAGLIASWWLLGRAVRTDQVTPRTVLLTAVLWAVPLLLAAPLASHDVYSYACQGRVYLSGADPYRVTPAGLPCRWLTAVAPIWRTHAAPYGPVAVVVSAAAAQGPLLLAVAALRAAAVAGLALLSACLPRLAARTGGDPASALWLGVANPLVLVHLVGGAHYDALLAGLVVAGLALAIGGRDVVSGVVLAAAFAVKATAIVVLPFAVLLAVTAGRSGTAGRSWVRAAAAVLLSAATTFVVLSVATGLDLGWVAALPLSDQPVAWLSPPSAVAATIGGLLSLFGVPDAIGTTVAVGRVIALYVLMPAALLAAWWYAVRARTPSAAVTGAGLALTATVVLAPVVYPWYAAAPLAVFAATANGRVRAVLAVAACAMAFVILPDSRNLAIMTRWPGVVVETAAIAVGLFLLIRRTGGMRRPKPG